VAAARLTAALRYGPASKTTVAPTAVTGLSADQLAERQKQAASRDKATAAVLENFKDYPDVADAALEAIQGSDHPEAFEGGVGQLCTIATGNFKGQATAAEARTMAKNAVKMAGAVGGDYLARMDAYYATDAAKQPDTLRDPDHKKSALNYTGAMGDALLADDGSVKADPAAFEAIRANLSFHPGSLKKPLTNLVQHVEKFREKVSDDEITATMQGITLQPQGGSKDLLATVCHRAVGRRSTRPRGASTRSTITRTGSPSLSWAPDFVACRTTPSSSSSHHSPRPPSRRTGSIPS